jgi:hypothetical protein
MQITMIPGLCSNEHQPTSGSFCEGCFASFLVHGCAPDRPCITNVVDDGKPETTIVLRYRGHQQAITIDDASRDLWAYGGWPGWVEYVEQLPKTPIGTSSD